MQHGWGNWSPLEGELPHLPNAYAIYTPEQQDRERPADYLPDLDLVLEYARRCGGPVLDLACGTGRLSLALAREGFEVVGLDLHAGFIRSARERLSALPPEAAARARFEVGDATAFRLPERFGLVIMMDQAFKYLLTHDANLDCLACVREHLRDDGRFLVEHRCLFRIPSPGEGEPYAFSWRGEEWVGIDAYDPVQQLSLSAYQPADDPSAPASLESIRDFTYQELSLLHRVTGWELEAVFHDLDERPPTADYFDAALVLKKAEPWRPSATTW